MEVRTIDTGSKLDFDRMLEVLMKNNWELRHSNAYYCSSKYSPGTCYYALLVKK